MEIKNLMSSRLFGELIRSEEPGFEKRIDYLVWYEKLRNNFDDFVKQTLELWMFVPCDLDGNVLKIIPFNEHKQGSNFEFMQHKLFDEAKERVLFEGFEVQNSERWISFYGGIRVYIPTSDLSNTAYVVFRENDTITKTIEDLVKYNLELTETAKKQIICQ